MRLGSCCQGRVIGSRKIAATLRTFRLRAFLSFVRIAVAVPPCLDAQTRAKGQESAEAQALAFAGCYELGLGRWWPWSFGGETKLVAPPRRINLLLTRGTVGFEEDQLLVRPLSDIKGLAPARAGPSDWQPKSDALVDLEWNDGFTGATLNLERVGKELSG
jgi:hypothetical protein